MSDDTLKLQVNTPALPKGGAAIQGTGKGWGDIGSSGTASFEIPLPVSPGRGYAPAMSLTYQSGAGNGPFGLGWGVHQPAVSRRTSHGVPGYTTDDVLVGPDAQIWLPERDAKGAIISSRLASFNGLPLPIAYTVTRHFPRVESRFDRIEHWQSATDTAGFWLIQNADGSQHFYGKTALARIADPDQAHHVAQWLLQESLNARGEHIYYHYQRETDTTRYPRDCRARHYLQSICYGNFTAKEQEQLYLWQTDDKTDVGWHFQLLFDYGERALELDQRPTYGKTRAWPARPDPCSDFAFGFELRTLRRCSQVLMFHHFPKETPMGADPVLVKRLLLEYRTSGHVSLLGAVHEQAFDSAGNSVSRPPLECFYQSSHLNVDPGRYQPFSALPRLHDSTRYQLVDLYGEGLPGVLYRTDKSWYYREPLRPQHSPTSDEVSYGSAVELTRVPVADSSRPIHQALADVSGDGRLDWLVAGPGMSGFFSLDEQRNWSAYTPFDAFPSEFFHPQGMLADLMGSGRHDVAMIGPRSVRLYENRRASGFAPATEVAHRPDDGLPIISSSPNELVAFSDVLATGQQHLVRVRHDEVKCWPNLGRGRFGQGFVLATLPLRYRTFNAAHVLLVDLDGGGATDLLYLTATHLLIFLNKGGNGFETQAINVPWPEGVQYDDHCQVSVIDVLGLGCPSLILTAAHQTPLHWRYDFFSHKPWLLRGTDNNMGAQAVLKYRSSAQEWLDEKRELHAKGQPAVSQLPFALLLVSQHTQRDEITGNQLTQSVSYRQAYYDRQDREFRGFGLLLQTDTDSRKGSPPTPGSSAPVLSKTWFHTGRSFDTPTLGHSPHDPNAKACGPTLVSRHRAAPQALPLDHHDDLISAPAPALARDVARALSGAVLRVEVMAANPAHGVVPYSVKQQRYLVRELAPASVHTPYARLLPLALESISYQYEGVADDPVCQHQINLRWDAYGCLVHGVTLHYARRTSADDTPPAVLVDEHQQRWWRDTHDSAQQLYYLSETLAQPIHLDDAQQWCLALPYRQRHNALVLGKAPAPGGLDPARIAYELFIDTRNGPLAAGAKRTLSGLSVQRYRQGGGFGKTLEPGVATAQALADYLETAELDDQALNAYNDIPAMPNQPTVDLVQKLTDVGYRPMTMFFLFDGETPPAENRLWSIRRHFPRYDKPSRFCRLRALRATEAHGETKLQYDPYLLQTVLVKTPDGCVTKAEYDYRLLLPTKIVDPNGTVQEALYDGFGQLLASSFHGHEQGLKAGFAALDSYRPLNDMTPGLAVKQAQSVLQDMASAHCYAPFSWMGSIDVAQVKPEWITEAYLLPGGHIRMSARARLSGTRQALGDSEKQLKALIDTASRTPVHGLMLQADRYPGDAEQQVRMTLTCWDGFGRSLQTKQKTEPGLAHAVDDKGNLMVDKLADASGIVKKQLRQVHADPRWRVSERVEYNNKGLVIRVYRAYFANSHAYVNDRSMRKLGHSDRQLYDPLGRPTQTFTAAGFMRRTTYWAWYTVNEDENDTYEELNVAQVPTKEP
ncbi:SpvB/TcaC N-terminal domain-containing protein [Pseudomonas sp. MUP55]|uniref:SpvB/TcaC N-terminal domain-containing protein n=1 Tax=Pseudomonas sp. MUP55 TaxID=3087234 RepID=UPI002A59F256|nr:MULTISPECIES: SpvB/TcaC N-terminal domain-containing protein [unclassified Pseudomonas]WPN91085.1 SpvB/TcaC N-terminal domain-containing protein [Pseudomonas sp. MUP56]WPN96611.1 SpvB/TcaC N-terminal domain-containing protein [Pseudomonas sp. MUP55]